MAQTRGVDRHDTVVTGLRRLLDRLDSDALAHQVVTAGERQIPGHARMSEEVRWGPVRTMAREVIEVCRRSVLGSVAPHPDDLRALEERACRRAAEGVPLEDVLRAYRMGMRLAWRELRRTSEPGEEQLLMVAAEAMLTFVDLVTDAVTRAYLGQRDAPVAERERSARQLLAALDEDRPLTGEQIDTAQQLGLTPGGPYLPFAIAFDPGSATAHSALAQRLRADGVLAVSEGTRTVGVGVTSEGLDAYVDPDSADAVLVVGYATGPGGVGPACRALRAAVASALAAGRRGRTPLTDFAPDVLLAVAPDLADAVAERVVGDLPADLRTTLEALVACGFDRGAAAAELGIHRNTLRHRTTRIREVSHVDLGTLPGQVTAYLAVRRRQQRTTAAYGTPPARPRPR